MNATPPEANSEYSRGPEPFEADLPLQVSAPDRRGAASSESSGVGVGGGARSAILAGGLLGALLLVVAEFTPLFEVSTGSGGGAPKSVGTGSHHAYAMLPIALLAAALAYGVWRVGSRPALLSIGFLAVISLLIALVGDLPDAHATGLLKVGARYVSASANPSTGLYMETLGGVVLLITCVCGFLLLGAPPRPAPPRRMSAS